MPLIFLVSICSVTANDPTVIKQFADWEAVTQIENGNLVCYAGTPPKKSKGKYKKRGPIYLLVTHRPTERSLNVVSIQFGYTFNKGTEVNVKLGNEQYTLFTHAGYAFAYDQKTDLSIVKSMIKGIEMEVKGVSSRGTKTLDLFSLKGFTAAYKAITSACNVK